MQPYDTVPFIMHDKCGELLKVAHLLFDTNALIYIMRYNASKFLKELSRDGTAVCLINPVRLEFLGIKNKVELIQRTEFLSKFEFWTLPVNSADFDFALELQNSFAENGYNPSAVDLILASITRKYQDNIFLFSANIKDFPQPYFKRCGFVTFQRRDGLSTVTLLRYNPKNEILPINRN